MVTTLPADLEDAWLLELLKPYRQCCDVDLAARRGHVVVRDPRANDAPAQQTADLRTLQSKAGACLNCARHHSRQRRCGQL